MVWCHPEAGSMAEGSRFSFCRIQTRDPSPPGMLPPLRSGCSASVSAFAREYKEVCHPEGSSTPEGSRSCFVFSQLRDPSPPGMLPPLRSGCSASVSAFAREYKEVCHPEGSSTPEGSRSCFVFSQLRDPSPPGMLPPLRSGCSASVSAFAREYKEVCHPEGSSTPEGSRSCFVLPNCEIPPLLNPQVRFLKQRDSSPDGEMNRFRFPVSSLYYPFSGFSGLSPFAGTLHPHG